MHIYFENWSIIIIITLQHYDSWRTCIVHFKNITYFEGSLRINLQSALLYLSRFFGFHSDSFSPHMDISPSAVSQLCYSAHIYLPVKPPQCLWQVIQFILIQLNSWKTVLRCLQSYGHTSIQCWGYSGCVTADWWKTAACGIPLFSSFIHQAFFNLDVWLYHASPWLVLYFARVIMSSVCACFSILLCDQTRRNKWHNKET